MTIVLLEPLHEDARALLANFDTTVLVETPEAVRGGLAAETTAILTRGRAQIDAALLERCGAVRVVARCGVGLDSIDLAAATRRAIPVIYAPGSTTDALAEHTLMLMLAATRRLRQLSAAVHRGEWRVRDSYGATELKGRTLGVVGMGAIGRRVADLAQAFGMRVVYWNRSPVASAYERLPLDELLAASDIVSLHLALTPETRQLIDRRALGLLRRGAILINTARGGIIDQAALTDAIDDGTVGYFASDVLAPEPPAADEPLLTSDRTMITPHTAALTDATFRAMCMSTVSNVLAVLSGGTPDPASVYRG